MKPQIVPGLLLAVGALALVSGCSTAKQVFPDTGGALVSLVDSGLGLQSSPNSERQVMIWTLQQASLSVPDLSAPYSYLATPPCQVASVPGFDGDLIRSCGGSSLTLEAGQLRATTVTLEVARMSARRAARPDLDDAGDYDGDGIPNGADNCRIVPNPDQANVNAGLESPIAGDACSALDPTTGAPTIPDQDLDGVRDTVDNCVWIPNPPSDGETAQDDANGDGIGDACEQEIAVVLPAGGLRLECSTEFTQPASGLVRFVIDFGAALACSPTSSVCALLPDEVTMTPSGGVTGDAVACTPSSGG